MKRLTKYSILIVFIWSIFSGSCVFSASVNEELIYASNMGDLETVRTLLDKGADVNARAKDGTTALMYASGSGNLDVVRLLIDRGADVKAKNDDGETAWKWASLACHSDIEKLLLSKGAEMDMETKLLVDNLTEQELIYAAGEGNISAVNTLLSKGVDVNAKDRDGVTALMRASESGHLDIARALLSKGASVNAKDNYGRSALSIAKKMGYGEAVQLLIKAGAKE